ncbi:hypothetical protein [Granulicella sibirica]|uniref:Uncharacterized protein n=1 Tax=Granulicella sibirica TaxID=2479048 RepID=A0A4Q0STA3_9BACT|nr:hypothetical protein [Granulicella sibirica]RXH53887.1 hypothetical protein GRAN_5225 [Granulicella sibirica]
MRKLTNKELLFLLFIFAPLSVFGLLVGSQLPNYFQATGLLGHDVFFEPRWWTVSALMAIFGMIGFIAALIVKQCIETLLKRYGIQ